MNFQNRRFDFMDLMDQKVCFDTPPYRAISILARVFLIFSPLIRDSN